MEFHLLHIFTFLSVALVVSHAAQVSEVYWKTVLPNTNMPKAVKDLLKSDGSTSIEVPKGKVSLNEGKVKPSEGSSMDFTHKSQNAFAQSPSDPDLYKYAANDRQMNIYPKSPSDPFSYHYANDDSQKSLHLQAPPNPFSYNYAADDSQKNFHPQAPSDPFSYNYAADNSQKNVHPQAPPNPFSYNYAASDDSKTKLHLQAPPNPFSYNYAAGDSKKNLHVQAPHNYKPISYNYAAGDSQKNLKLQAPPNPFSYNYANDDSQKNVPAQAPSDPFSYQYAGDDSQKNLHLQAPPNPLSYNSAYDNSQKNVQAPSDPFSYQYAGAESQKNTYPKAPSDPFSYDYAAKKLPHKNEPTPTIFFLEKDLHQGTKMNLQFVKFSNPAVFLPRKVADTIPFSSQKIPEIFKRLSINPNSREARVIKNTIQHCEEPSIKDEEKLCVTSLESMIDFSISQLGKSVQAISTEAENATQVQEYSIVGLKKMAGEKSMVCHKQNYPYAVFYCHKSHATKAYLVSMVGVHGGKSKAVAVCHQNTSEWNPKHMAFVLLKVKPGTVPICHFLPEDHMVWIPK